MITLYDKFVDTQPHDANQELIDHTLQEYIGSFERRMLCFESAWQNNLYNKQSVKPFIMNLDQLVEQPITVGYKYFESGEQLKFYLKWPDGEAWKNPVMWANSMTYIGCHGEPAGLQLPLGLVTHGELKNIFQDYGSDTSSVLYFSACSLFQVDEFGWELLEASKCRGIFGFKKDIGFTTGLLLDLVVLSTFYLYLDGDPFKHLVDIYESVLESFPLAKEAGFTLYVP
jgi:hypothetical protein